MMMHVGSLFVSLGSLHSVRPGSSEVSIKVLNLQSHGFLLNAWIKSPSTCDNKQNLSLSHHIGARGCTLCNFKVHVFQDWLGNVAWMNLAAWETLNLGTSSAVALSNLASSPPSAQINRMDWCFFEHAGLQATYNRKDPNGQNTRQWIKHLCKLSATNSVVLQKSNYSISSWEHEAMLTQPQHLAFLPHEFPLLCLVLSDNLWQNPWLQQIFHDIPMIFNPYKESQHALR